MDKQRESLYSALFDEASKTPLVTYEGEVPNGNTIVVKRECDLRFGSHYDRVFLQLYYGAEQAGLIKPGQKVLETTSGSAGVSFAGYGHVLGYECLVAIPEGGEKARENAIRAYLPSDDHLIFTSGNDYISGFPSFLRRYLRANPEVYFMNHSMGRIDRATKKPSNNEITLEALSGIAKEVTSASNVDIFVSAVGNGSNVLGVGKPLKEHNRETRVIAYETFQSAVAHNLVYPGQYKAEYGLKPGTLSRHRLPGTSFNGIDFPHIRNSVNERIIDGVILVSDVETDSEYGELQKSFNGVSSPENLPHWDAHLPLTDGLGRTTKAGLAVALQTSETVEDKTILIIGYDKADRYDQQTLG